MPSNCEDAGGRRGARQLVVADRCRRAGADARRGDLAVEDHALDAARGAERQEAHEGKERQRVAGALVRISGVHESYNAREARRVNAAQRRASCRPRASGRSASGSARSMTARAGRPSAARAEAAPSRRVRLGRREVLLDPGLDTQIAGAREREASAGGGLEVGPSSAAEPAFTPWPAMASRSRQRGVVIGLRVEEPRERRHADVAVLLLRGLAERLELGRRRARRRRSRGGDRDASPRRSCARGARSRTTRAPRPWRGRAGRRPAAAIAPGPLPRRDLDAQRFAPAALEDRRERPRDGDVLADRVVARGPEIAEARGVRGRARLAVRRCAGSGSSREAPRCGAGARDRRARSRRARSRSRASFASASRADRAPTHARARIEHGGLAALAILFAMERARADGAPAIVARRRGSRARRRRRACRPRDARARPRRRRRRASSCALRARRRARRRTRALRGCATWRRSSSFARR